MEHADILHRCFRCGYCKFTGDYNELNCPSYRKFRFESFSAGGRMWLIRAWLNGEIEASDRLAEILYSCTACRNCVEQCVFKFKDYLLDAIVAARRKMVEAGRIPPAVRDYLKSLQVYGNPYKRSREERGRWAEGTGLGRYEGQEYLFYPGSVSSYDVRGQKIARCLADLLVKAGISVGILGGEEEDDGNEVRMLGEADLFEALARQNIEKFRQYGVKKVVVLSPHAYNAMKNYYPALGADFELVHYTRLLLALIGSGRLKPSSLQVKVTYHDPCLLGRHNGEYDAPRRLLEAIPGVQLVEMANVRQNAFCCGGGGGNFFTDIIGGGEDSPSRIRIREACETGAEVVAVACPKCARMLDDALRAEGLEGQLAVRDIAEIVHDACRL